MAAGFTPEDGDIVVRQDTRDGKCVYVLHTAPGADQFVIQTREQAVARAVGFAKRHGVRVWLTDSDHDFTLVEDFRGSAPV